MTYKKELEIFFRFRKSQFGKKSSDQKDDSDDAKESFVNKINLQKYMILQCKGLIALMSQP